MRVGWLGVGQVLRFGLDPTCLMRELTFSCVLQERNRVQSMRESIGCKGGERGRGRKAFVLEEASTIVEYHSA
eukprot:1349806-Amorphochlora_amoeboformis.AAC.1